MVIAPDAMIGTIGGGALEFMVIDRARQALRNGEAPEGMDVPLGPEIGQCCGGRVEVGMRVLDAELAQALISRLNREEAALPDVFMFGSGHVGRALAKALAALPLKVHVIDAYEVARAAGMGTRVGADNRPIADAQIRNLRSPVRADVQRAERSRWMSSCWGWAGAVGI